MGLDRRPPRRQRLAKPMPSGHAPQPCPIWRHEHRETGKGEHRGHSAALRRPSAGPREDRGRREKKGTHRGAPAITKRTGKLDGLLRRFGAPLFAPPSPSESHPITTREPPYHNKTVTVRVAFGLSESAPRVAEARQRPRGESPVGFHPIVNPTGNTLR